MLYLLIYLNQRPTASYYYVKFGITIGAAKEEAKSDKSYIYIAKIMFWVTLILFVLF